MDKCEELSEFDKGQVVIARKLGLSAAETAKLVGCSRAAVVRTYRQWSKEEHTTTREVRPARIAAKAKAPAPVTVSAEDQDVEVVTSGCTEEREQPMEEADAEESPQSAV